MSVTARSLLTLSGLALLTVGACTKRPIPSSGGRDSAVRPECEDRTSDGYYFPKAWVDSSSGATGSDGDLRHRYAQALRTMSEPSLSCEAPPYETFRCLLLREWGPPLAVRIAWSHARGNVTAVQLDDSGGDAALGNESHRMVRELTDREWITTSNALRELNFWDLPSQADQPSPSRSSWILEGRNTSQYQVIESGRVAPARSSSVDFCTSLLALIDWPLPKRE
jgi:hypothetical protein